MWHRCVCALAQTACGNITDTHRRFAFVKHTCATFILLSLTLTGCVSHRTHTPPQWGALIRLANDEIEVVIAPERGGRIMHYSRLGEPNLLWTVADINSGFGDVWGWRNWGGEKTWLWPQENWPNGDWPPPLDVEQHPWQVDFINETTVTMSAETQFGKMMKFISIATGGTELDIYESIENREDTPVPFSVWTVVQIPVPETVEINRTEPRRLLLQMPDADTALVLRDENTIDISATPDGTKGMLDADTFRVPTAQGVLVVQQHCDDTSGYETVYRV
ncbi:MAG: DUF4380 domain-containing protein, partial [Kiritimatiellaeota bacterium]|nr:DUF4380 domain-containing protein [Kiritimatiellota bacterium]